MWERNENSGEVIASEIHENDWVALECFATLESHRQCDSNLHIQYRRASSIADILMMIMQVLLSTILDKLMFSEGCC